MSMNKNIFLKGKNRTYVRNTNVKSPKVKNVGVRHKRLDNRSHGKNSLPKDRFSFANFTIIGRVPDIENRTGIRPGNLSAGSSVKVEVNRVPPVSQKQTTRESIHESIHESKINTSFVESNYDTVFWKANAVIWTALLVVLCLRKSK